MIAACSTSLAHNAAFVAPTPPQWPLVEDADQDGLRDADEILLWFNPFDASDGLSDIDADGLSLAWEFQLGTSPDRADTDFDGWTDSDEVLIFGTNPLDGLAALQNPQPLQVQPLASAPTSNSTAATPVPPPTPSLSNGDFSAITIAKWTTPLIYTKSYQGNSFEWGEGGATAWSAYVGSTIEVWRAGGGTFVELDGNKSSYGIKQPIANARAGGFVMAWKQSGRNDAPSKTDAYSVRVYYQDAAGKEIVLSQSPTYQGFDKMNWTDNAHAFTITAAHITAAATNPIYVAFIPQDLNTFGTLIDNVSLVPVEVKYVNRDAPNFTWATTSAIKDLPFGQPLYSQPPRHLGDNKVNAGDLVSWEIKFTDDMASRITFAWEAYGPEGLNPLKVATFGGVGKKKWKIEKPLDWRPGKYNIRCKMGFANGNQTTLELNQEIGVRSGEVMVVGWIDADAINLSDGHLHPTQQPGAWDNSIEDILNTNWQRGLFMTWVIGGNHLPPMQPEGARKYFNAYMIKNAGNQAPPQHFRTPIPGNSMEMVDAHAILDFLSNARNYRLANRLQVKFLVDEKGKIKDEPFVAPRGARAGLTTFHLAPEKWIDLFNEGTFDNIPAEEGPFHNLINKNGQEFKFNTADIYSAALPDSIAQYAQARIADTGNVSGGNVSKKINGRDIPWIWSEVKFKAPLAQGTVTTNPIHEKFPAVWVYFNGELIEALKDPIDGNDLENFIQLGKELNN